MTRRASKSYWFRVLVTFLLLALLLTQFRVRDLWTSLSQSNTGLLACSLALTPVIVGVKTLRWLVLARTQRKIGFAEALHSYLVGLALATVTPFAVGEVGRGFFVQGTDHAEMTGKVILDKVIDLLTVFLFSALGLLITGNASAARAGGVLLVGVAGAWAGLFLLPRLVWQPKGRIGEYIERFHFSRVLEGLRKTPFLKLLLNAGLALIGFVVFYFQAFVLLQAFYDARAPLSVVPYFPIITVSTILPIAIGGVGVREWIAVLLLRNFGIPSSVAFNAFFSHFVIVQLLPALVGVYYIAVARLDARQSVREASGEDLGSTD
jgi:uncharacterized membrane protein YbhN (UPF0104 family)